MMILVPGGLDRRICCTLADFSFEDKICSDKCRVKNFIHKIAQLEHHVRVGRCKGWLTRTMLGFDGPMRPYMSIVARSLFQCPGAANSCRLRKKKRSSF